MTRLRQKLRSRRGASILIALVFFLLCLTVGGVVLTAATASAGRLAAQRQTQQDYLTVSSAAALVRDSVEERRFQYVVENYDTDHPGFSSSLPEDAIPKALETAARTIARGSSASAVLFITGPEGMETVTGDLTLDDQYNLTVTLSLPGEEGEFPRSPLTLSVPAMVQTLEENWTVWVSTGVNEAGEETGYDEPHSRITTTVTWGEGAISKAKGAGT